MVKGEVIYVNEEKQIQVTLYNGPTDNIVVEHHGMKVSINGNPREQSVWLEKQTTAIWDGPEKNTRKIIQVNGTWEAEELSKAKYDLERVKEALALLGLNLNL